MQTTIFQSTSDEQWWLVTSSAGARKTEQGYIKHSTSSVTRTALNRAHTPAKAGDIAKMLLFKNIR